jgi:TIR domain
MSGQIFISYRRSDSLGSTGRLYDRLLEHFGPDRIFMDVDTIAPGVDFVDAIEEAVSKCDVLIAVIGAGWLQSSDNKGRRRLDDPEDIVRLEIGTALKRNIRVIPVLVENILMPTADELPDELRPLTRRNALELSHTRYKADVDRLINALNVALKPARGAADEKTEAAHMTAENVGAKNIAVGEAMPVVKVREKGQAEEQAAKQRETKQIVTEEPGRVLFSRKAYKRWGLFGVHTNCEFIVRTTDIEFVDHEGSSNSFKIPIEKLRHATFTKPRGWLGSENDLLVILRDGTEYDVGFDRGGKKRALEAINKALEA